MATVSFAWMANPTTSTNVAVVALSDRLAWAEAQGDRPLRPNGPTAKTYVQGFVRKPGMGSYVTQAGEVLEHLSQVAGLFECLEWTEVHPHDAKPGNKYYQGRLGETSVWQAFQEATTLENLEEEKLQSVRVRKGPHGLELFCPGGQGKQTKTVTIIIDGDGLVTWFPGDITPPVDVAKATVKLG